MPRKHELDLFVIGAGSAGTRAARMAASYGAGVAVAEMHEPGGTCVNAGCIPKKLLYYSSGYTELFHDAIGYGWNDISPRFDWQQLLRNKDREIERLNGIYRKRLIDAGVQILPGKAVVTGPHTVTINGTPHTTDKILVATGSHSARLDIPGAEFAITSDEAFHLPQLPRKILIVGGGYIALEFAGIFNSFGVETLLVHRGSLPLSEFDDEIRRAMVEELRKKGVRLLLNTMLRRIESADKGYRIVCSNGEEETADLVMFAVGRQAAATGFGLQQQGVKLDQDGAIITNKHYQTSVPSIYAIGDVTGGIMLTPVAIAEAMALTAQLYGQSDARVDYGHIPTCVFSQPNAAMVGLTEAQARNRFDAVDVYRSQFRPLKHTLTGNSEKMMMKLIVDRSTDKVVGAHMIGADAGEIIQGFAVAIRAGATKSLFDSTVGIHPTAAEEFVTMRPV